MIMQRIIDEEGKRYIRENYLSLKTKEIAQELGCTQETIRNYAYKLGIKKGRKFKNVNKCDGCQLFVNGHCVYRLEDMGQSCKYMRFEKSEWPKEKSQAEIVLDK